MISTMVRKLGAVVLALFAFNVQAGLLGATADVDFYYPDTSSLYCSNGTAVIGAGVEYPGSCSGFGPVSIDIADSSLIVSTGGTPWSAGTFNGFVLDILGGIDIASAAYVGGSMGVTGISIVGGDLWLNFAGQSGGTATFSLSDSSGVPEPASLLLVGLALVGLAGSRRKVR